MYLLVFLLDLFFSSFLLSFSSFLFGEITFLWDWNHTHNNLTQQAHSELGTFGTGHIRNWVNSWIEQLASA